MSLRYALSILFVIPLAASTALAPNHAHADDIASFNMTDVNISRPELGFETLFGHYGGSSLAGLQGWFQLPLGDRWALTARLPLAYAIDDQRDGLALGNLTVDGTLFLNTRRRRRATNVTAIRLSVSAPTASRSGDGYFASDEFNKFYLPEPGWYQPNTTTLRLYATWRTGSRSFFGQLEGGMQQLIRPGDNNDQTLVRVAGGMGVRVGRSVVLIGEFVGMTDFLDDTDGDNFWSSLDLGMRARVGRGNLRLRGILPLDGARRANDALGIALGYEVSM